MVKMIPYQVKGEEVRQACGVGLLRNCMLVCMHARVHTQQQEEALLRACGGGERTDR